MEIINNNAKILTYKLYVESLVGNIPISDYDKYIEGMNKSMEDKLFFINKIDFDVIVDFGCANGIFLSMIKKLKPNVKLIGYDLDDEMIIKSKNLLGGSSIITNNWNSVINELKNYKNPLLNLSSVIHEVYSYSTSKIIKKFWEEQVFGGNFKYISIRDMIPSLKIHKKTSFENDVYKIRKISDKNQLKDFENKWGSINNDYRTLLHFLLKYKYTDNWDREVIEDYFPVSIETLKTKIPDSYKIIYEQDFIVPFIKDQIKKDFNITLENSTHVKIIIKYINF